MARPLRIEYPGAYYHVMNRGQSRRSIFIEDQGRQTFLDLLADMARLWKVKIYAYCLMDNHYAARDPYRGPDRKDFSRSLS
jgi:putative transposase